MCLLCVLSVLCSYFVVAVVVVVVVVGACVCVCACVRVCSVCDNW